MENMRKCTKLLLDTAAEVAEPETTSPAMKDHELSRHAARQLIERDVSALAVDLTSHNNPTTTDMARG
jgi:hypothetical protein